MKFRTEIAIIPSPNKIDQQQKIFSIGSCFATEMAHRLDRIGVATRLNPLGVVYNPLSVCSTLERVAEQCEVVAEELHQRDDVWFSYHTHGDFDSTNASEVVGRINDAISRGHTSLAEADWLIITLGTAWVYEHKGEVVANCHKMPAGEFVRRRLSVEEVVGALTKVADRFADKRIILTISPIRHLSDGLEGNSLSKAVLRVAASEVASARANVSYFPAYEILLDDLRDYRFYAADMTHPAEVAVEYVWERFAECYLSSEARAMGEKFASVAGGLTHRPLHPESAEWSKFKARMLERAKQLAEALPNNEVAIGLAEKWAEKCAKDAK